MDSFKQFMEALFGFGKRPANPEEVAALKQHYADKDAQEHQAAIGQLKKAVEDFAKDPRGSRKMLSNLIMPSKDFAKQFGRNLMGLSLNPIYRLANYHLTEIPKDKAITPEQKAAHQKEVEEILKHALAWFDATQPEGGKRIEGDRSIGPMGSTDFDWGKQKELALKRAKNYRARRTGAKTLRGPWEY